jgi:phosphoglycerate dehydrogenase-like enzyme
MSSISSDLSGSLSSPCETRIVVALTSREWKLFFSDQDPDATAGWHFLSDADLAPRGWRDCLERLHPTILVTAWSTPPLPESWLDAPGCPLRMVCHVTGSVRNLLPRSFIARGGVVTNWGGTISAQVAEHALLLALAGLRNTAQWPGFIARPANGRQIEQLGTKTLFGRRVGLHGFGSVARALIPLLHPFAVSLSAYSAGVPPELMQAAGVESCRSPEELFSRSDVLFECEALTPATAGAVSSDLLARLPDDAVFVNIGRGGIVDDAALNREARSGRLRVALDVVANEPLTPASPYFGLPNVVLSPHIAGPTRDRYAQCGAFALASLRAFLRGETPSAAITLAAYDRAT